MRPSWDEYFLGIAEAVSLRGDCTRSKVGAVLIESGTHRILSTGYNGVEPGRDGCLSGGCPRGLLSFEEQPAYGNYDNCVAKHAEENCLKWWRDRHGVNVTPVWMYITRQPCEGCESLMGDYGVSRFIWRNWGSPEGFKYWDMRGLA